MGWQAEEVPEWLHENCAVCRHRGDRLWINIRCPAASRIVWTGPPYAEADEEFIRRLVRLGQCRNFVLDTESEGRRKRRKRAAQAGQHKRVAGQVVVCVHPVSRVHGKGAGQTRQTEKEGRGDG